MKHRKFVLTVVLMVAALAPSALASCQYSLDTTSIANGQPANAGPIMNNFNYVLTCPNFTGNVGIGTPSPTYPLDIQPSAAGAALRVKSTTGYNASVIIDSPATQANYLSFANAGTEKWEIGLNAGGLNANALIIYDSVNNLGRMAITNTGNVGIGTASPQHELSIRSDQGGLTQLSIWNNNINGQAGVYLRNSASGSELAYGALLSLDGYNTLRLLNQFGNPLIFGTNNTERVRIDSAGNVGIGTTSPSYALHVNGTAYATGAAGALSDIRDKHDIRPLSFSALGIITSLRPVTFYWKAPRDSGMKGMQTGLIAQDVEKLLPASILTADDARHSKAIKYNEITVILAKALQEEHTLVESQARQIAALRRDNIKLSERISRLEKMRLAKLR